MQKKVVDLTKPLAKYKSGWIALNNKNEVVEHAKTLESIVKKTKDKKDISLLPASQNYFGIIT